ncbi:MAG: hypothetical protein ABR551_03880 [Gemmatimonadales bacterium]
MRMPPPVQWCLPVILLLGSGQALAQDVERRGFIGLGIGPSVPYGSFADASSANVRAGHATSGYTNTLLNLGYRFGRRLGVAAALSYSEYPSRDGGDDDWWQVAGVTVGPLYSVRLNARTAVDLKAMVGLMVLTPVVDGFTTGDGIGTGPAVDLRAAVRYDVFTRWALFAEGGLQSSRVSFDTGVRTDYRAMISSFGIAFRPAW